MRTMVAATAIWAGLCHGAIAAQLGPDAESVVTKIVSGYVETFAAAQNDMAKGMVRNDRGHALCASPIAFIAAKGVVRDWTGTVKDLDSTGDGRGILAVAISPTITLRTTNNTFSEDMTNTPTLIPARSKLFAPAVKLTIGQKVRFSGNFYPSVQDCMQETSLTTDGSMTEPDYLFRFTAIAPAE